MPEFERSETIDADPARTYEFLADPRNLPKYVATMVMATPESQNRLHVAADVSGRHEEGHASFHGDPALRRIQWSGTSSNYQGWLQVSAADGNRRSTVTIHLTTNAEAESAEIKAALAQTLDNIKREVTRS